MDCGSHPVLWAWLRRLRLPALFAVLCVTTGCMANGPGPAAMNSSFGPTVAFDSVDGPPPQVFDRLVRALESEQGSRSFTVVSRDAPASFRVRSYLSAQVRRGRTTIAWVWDVYDGNQQRAMRLSGEEPGGKSSKDAWATADDQVMRRIAQSGMNGLNGLINGTGVPSDDRSPAAPSTGQALAEGGGASGENEPESAPGQMQTLAFSAH